MASNVEKKMLLPQADDKQLQGLSISSPVALLSFSSFGLTVFGASVQLILMIFTYVTCVRNGECEQWLPTISNTWTSYPGTYSSRIVVPFVCFLMQFAIAISYFKCVPLMEYPKANYGIGAFAFFCLSWVGAICDSSEPSCRGNDTVHTTFAITFFILFNLYMAIVTIFVTKKSTHKIVLLTCVFLSTVCTITRTRAALGYESLSVLDSFPLVPIVEWSDVFIILVWFTVWVYFELSDYRMGFAKIPKTGVTSKQGATTEILAFLPATQLTTIASVIFAVTVASSWYIAVKNNVVPSDELPNISDIWWAKPSNWIARWGVNLTALLLYFHEGNCYFMSTDAKPSNNKAVALALSLLGLVGSFGLAMVGVMSEKENSQLHDMFGAIFFFAYNAYMLFYVIRAASSPSQIPTAMVLLCFALSSVSKLRFWDADMFSGNSAHQTSLALFEWGDMLVTLLFINISVRFNPATKTQDTYGVALFKQN